MKRKWIFSISLLLVGASGLHAVAVPEEKASNVYVAPAWEYVHSSWGNGTKQTGSLWGALAGYAYEKKDSWYFLAEFNYMAGILKGSAGNDPTQEYITEVRGGYNLAAPFGPRFSITPFVGVASYIFNQTISGGNSFNSNFWYAPIGLFFDYKINKSWKVGFLGMGAPTFAGRWKVSKWRDAPTSALWKGELFAIYTGCLPFEFSLVPFVKGWAYKNDGSLTEQRNTYYGLKALFGYRF